MVGSTLRSVYERTIASGDHVYRSTNYIKVYTCEPVVSDGPVLFDVRGLRGDGLEGCCPL